MTAEVAVVSVRTGQPAALVAFRDEASAVWQAFPASGKTTFDFATSGPYRVVVVCATPGNLAVRSSQYARTPQDEPVLEHTCGTVTAPFIVSGRVTRAAAISLGIFGEGTSAQSPDFNVVAAPGLFDLVIFTGDSLDGFDGIAIRRDVAITGDTELGTIDLASEGLTPTVATTLRAANPKPGETLRASASLDTGSTQTSFASSDSAGPDTGSMLYLIPDRAMRPSDRQTVSFSAFSSSTSSSRWVLRDYRVGDPAEIALPDALGPVLFDTSTDRFAATWTSLPEYDSLSLSRRSFTFGHPRAHELELTRSFVEATGEAVATLDFRDIPGFKEDWRLDTGARQLLDFTASRGTAGDFSGASVTESIDPTMAPAGAR